MAETTVRYTATELMSLAPREVFLVMVNDQAEVFFDSSDAMAHARVWATGGYWSGHTGVRMFRVTDAGRASADAGDGSSRRAKKTPMFKWLNVDGVLRTYRWEQPNASFGGGWIEAPITRFAVFPPEVLFSGMTFHVGPSDSLFMERARPEVEMVSGDEDVPPLAPMEMPSLEDVDATQSSDAAVPGRYVRLTCPICHEQMNRDAERSHGGSSSGGDDVALRCWHPQCTNLEPMWHETVG